MDAFSLDMSFRKYGCRFPEYDNTVIRKVSVISVFRIPEITEILHATINIERDLFKQELCIFSSEVKPRGSIVALNSSAGKGAKEIFAAKEYFSQMKDRNRTFISFVVAWRVSGS